MLLQAYHTKLVTIDFGRALQYYLHPSLPAPSARHYSFISLYVTCLCLGTIVLVGTELTFSQLSSHLPLLCIGTQTWEMPGWLSSTSPDFAPEHLQFLCSAALSSLSFFFFSFLPLLFSSQLCQVA